MPRHHYKEKRRHRVEMMIQRELARAEILLDQNAQAMSVLTKALDNEPRGLKQAFSEIQKLGSESGKENA
jgi:hypothetical protein